MKLTEREHRAYELMLRGGMSAEGLARRLKISSATTSRVIAAMRRKGVPIASVRENGSWHLEIRDADDVIRRQYENLHKLIGFAKRWKPMAGKTEDDIIY